MASTTIGLEPSSNVLKYQTWVLKVSIHCQGCKRKVKKVLLGIDGVYTASVDSQQQRVTVTGNIEAETLIKKLIKTGKHAEIWHEKLASKEKESAKANTTQKQNDPNTAQNNGRKKSVKFIEDAKNVEKSPGNSTNGQETPAAKNNGSENDGGGGGGGSGAQSGGKKKKKGPKGDDGKNDSGAGTPLSDGAAGTGYQTQGMNMDQVVGPSNFIPIRQHSVPFPQGFNIRPVYASSYNMANPRESHAPFYYVLPSSVSSPYAYPPRYQVTPSNSFYYFSDENVDGCSIM